MDQQFKAERLYHLYERIQRDSGYRSTQMGTVFVPGRGSLAEGAVVLVGEAPGKEEERERAPFVGPAGRNLNELLQAAGIRRDDVFITNLVKYRPLSATGGNRNPSPAESRKALPYLLEELSILAPSLAICLGLSPASALLTEKSLKMAQVNGSLFHRHGLKILVTYHPSPFNYRVPTKREAMQAVFERLREML